METITIKTEWVKLDQALKLANYVESGGHAKLLIQDGLVKLNGAIEYQRGKKVKVGDIVEVENEKFKVIGE